MLCRNLLPGLLSARLIAATRLGLHSPPWCKRLNLDGWGDGHRLEGPDPGSEAGGHNDIAAATHSLETTLEGACWYLLCTEREHKGPEGCSGLLRVPRPDSGRATDQAKAHVIQSSGPGMQRALHE